MRYLFSMLVTFAWALWFGGLIALFLIVTRLFKTFSAQPIVFGQAGSATFYVFKYYQLWLAAAALLFTFLWNLAAPSTAKYVLFWVFALTTVATVGGMLFITPRLERLRLDNQTRSLEFLELHERSMMLYTGQTALLLVGGLLLPLGYRRDARSDPDPTQPPTSAG
jgi:hypothetical protein